MTVGEFKKMIADMPDNHNIVLEWEHSDWGEYFEPTGAYSEGAFACEGYAQIIELKYKA